jgi:hypothetical protein
MVRKFASDNTICLEEQYISKIEILKFITDNFSPCPDMSIRIVV